VLVLDRPDAGNAITPELILDLSTALDAAASAPVRAVLMRAEGPNFCVGADLRHFTAHRHHIAEELSAMADTFHATLARLTELPVPVVAQVQGAAVGAGLGLVLAADAVVCAESAKLMTGYARLGLSADAGVSFFLTRALGMRRARWLLMSGRPLGAREALELGLCDEVCEPADLPARASAVAEQLALLPVEAAVAVKRLTAEAAAGADLRTQLDRERQEITRLAAGPQLASALAPKG
jgi:2-(1,2-epoxy-1,2-dihydrophenyl)acetyl-CoA isomerase